MVHFFKPKNNKSERIRASSTTNKLAASKTPLKKVEQLLITRLSDDGRGIATLNGKTVFIENALPNEIVDVTFTNEKSNFCEAFANTIKNKSSHRCLPKCRHYDVCGGCHLQHLTLKEQQDFKLQNVLSRLMHVGKIVPDNILPTITGGDYYYRQRVRLSVVQLNNKILLGFRKKNSKALVDINECAVMAEPFFQLSILIRDWLNEYKPSVSHVELINGDNHSGVIIRHIQPISIITRKALSELLKSFEVTCWFQPNKGEALTTIEGKICEPLLNYTLKFLIDHTTKQLIYSFHPQDFIQANAIVNQKMIDQALALLQPKANEIFLDLFCGVGNFTLALSLTAKYVFGIEGSKKMVSQAASNSLSNACNNTGFKQADLFDPQEVEKLIDSEDNIKTVDGIILDPPRAGAKLICQNIKKLSPNRILYISCDPNTFIRDAQLLIDNNYTLKDFGVMDMFAQTYHSEVMGLFVYNSQSYIKSPKAKII
jgi:23S rRNA (uracil1939-C5)-methyltransferase